MAIIPRTIKGIRQHIDNLLFIQWTKRLREACISRNNVNTRLAIRKDTSEVLAIVVQDA